MTGEASRPAPAEDAELGGQRRGCDQSLQPRIVDTTRHNTEPSSGQMSVRVLKEVRALALALDHNGAGQYQRAADILAQRAYQGHGAVARRPTLGESPVHGTPRPRGATLVKRDEAVMVSKEMACELKMRRVQTGKGNGGCKEDLKGAPKGEKGEKGEKGRGRERGTSLRQREGGGGFVVNGRSFPRKAGSTQGRGDR